MHEANDRGIRVLIVSSGVDAKRVDALSRLVGDVEATFADAAGPLGALDGFDAIVVDGLLGAQPTEDLIRLRDAVERGTALVAIGAAPEGPGFWAELLGVTAQVPTPKGEYFAKVCDTHRHLTDRLADEFPVVDHFSPLKPADGTAVVVTVNVGFRDHPAITRRSLGRGHIVVSGLGRSHEALANPDLARLLRRALTYGRQGQSAQHSIGVAVIGYGPFGGMGYYHGLAARSVDGLEFVATCDPSVERRKAAEEDFPGVRAYATADELANDEEVGIVVIATPPVFHAGLALQMLRAGKHVACEKPLSLTVAEADLLLATALDNHLVLTVNQNRRWDPDFGAVRRAVEAGLLGDLFNIETFVGGFGHPCRAWHSEVTMSGGAVYDWGAHHVDWILQLMGSPPAVVRTHGHKRVWHDVTNLDQLRLRMLWDDGREAEFFQSDIAAVRRPKFYVQGTAGTLVGHYRPVTFERLEAGRGYVAETAHHAEAPADLTLSRYESNYGISDTHLPPAPEQRFAFHRNLADHLHLGEPLAVTPQSARQVIAVLEASQQSSDEGGREIALSVH